MNFIKEQINKSFSPQNATGNTALFEGKLCGTARYDLPCIYHHLHESSRVTVLNEDNSSVAVYYRNFKLGYLPARSQSVIKKLLGSGRELKARITHLEKKKYLPTESVTVKIEVK